MYFMPLALRPGDVESAKRLAAELNGRDPFDTWRERSPMTQISRRIESDSKASRTP
jgi:hypothetical protein